jgi:hypothetical protein
MFIYMCVWKHTPSHIKFCKNTAKQKYKILGLIKIENNAHKLIW